MTDPLLDHMVQRHKDFVRRFNASDADGIGETSYEADATNLPPDQRVIVGREAIREFLRTFHAKRNRRCAITVDQVESSGWLAYVIGSCWVEVRQGNGEVFKDRGSYLESWRSDHETQWWCEADMYLSASIRDANETKNLLH